MMKRRFLVLLSLMLSAGSLLLLRAGEGMYPISEIQKLDLRAMGLRVSAADLYNPTGTGLIDAIVKIGGCTGSFISSDGLIITNHHCVFGYVQAASTKEHDYVTNGFRAVTRGDEMRARGSTVRITESYRDVTRDVMSAVSDTMDSVARMRGIEARIRTIVAASEKENPGKRAEVSEMLPGKSYLLFISIILRDVRVVYVPPRSIGEFGGETDNWVWPRHTGDFSFVRAYVAPDGSPADFSPDNVPYHPRKFLKVQPDGVQDEDAVFMLGYPGRTFRHRTSHYMAFEEDVRMPLIAGIYEWQIAEMERLGAADRGIALKYDARIKGLANTAKNYRGKLQGMRRTQLVAKKVKEEAALQQFIEADPARKARYGNVLRDVGAVYDSMRGVAMYEVTLDNLRSASGLLSLSLSLYEASTDARRTGNLDDSTYVQRTVARLKDLAASTARDLYPPGDRALLREVLLRALRLPANQRIKPVDESVGDGPPEERVDKFLDDLYRHTGLVRNEFVNDILHQPLSSWSEIDDPFVSFAGSLTPLIRELRARRQAREDLLSKLSADLIEVKQEFLKKDFIPDANSTLRFTYGRIRGYSPADATYYGPITTLRGVIEKTTGAEPFNTPQKLIEVYRAGKFGRYALPHEATVPVGLLYDLDTTGGNSGSPLLNAAGELVGVNFDRAFEATINDYAWSEDYSRSIAVDIRYVLWVTEQIGGADTLLQEIGVFRE